MQLPGFEEKSEQNCSYRLDFSTPQGWVRVKQFTNGTLYLEATDSNTFQQILRLVDQVTGSDIHWDREKDPSPKRAPATRAMDSDRGRIELDLPYIGTDESGKGDYFGPLVIAGVYVTPETALKLKSLGVIDSKLLKEAQIKQLASKIQLLVGSDAWNIIEISPKRYNELYASFKKSGKNLNHLLAWGHAKALEILLEKNPECRHAIADQFGSEHYIRSQLQTRGRQIELHQTPKAEANVGVAAASILARARFVHKIKVLGERLGTPLPLGAGTLVLEKAKWIVKQHGPEALPEIAKLHFKTTEAIGLSVAIPKQ